MADDSIPPEKKHRIIGWKPEATDLDTHQESKLPKWLVGLIAGGSILLIAGGLVAGYFGWRLYEQNRQAELLARSGSLDASISVGSQFQTVSRAEYAREQAMLGMESVRSAGTDNPNVKNRLIEMELALQAAHKSFGDGKYAFAIQQYNIIAEDTKAFAQALEDRRIANEMLQQFHLDRARVEEHKPYAPDVFESALTAAGAARTFLNEGSFRLARAKIGEATELLHSVEKIIAENIRQNVAEGRAALGRGDGEAATAAFTRALELQPGNDVIVAGLERAKIIGQVFALNRQAAQFVEQDRLEDALEIYQQAFALDPQSATAQGGIVATKLAIRDRDFGRAMDQAKAAAADNDWTAAISAYETALRIIPDQPEVKRNLAEARVREREAYIATSLESAYALERSYSWDDARAIYLRILDFEPGQTEAEEGLLRTGKVIRALLKFGKLIEDARTLARQASFQSAIQTFNEAMASKPAYLELSPDQRQLKNMLESQSRPIEVTFVSDKRTWVTVLGYRPLDRFEKVTVPIMPGNYVVIGRRRGYEEVREILRVRANDPIPPITVVATTKLASL